MLREVPRVREDFGYPPLVTPSSQNCGFYASSFQRIDGRTIQNGATRVKGIIKGEYGKTQLNIRRI